MDFQQLLADLARRYPDIWKKIDKVRLHRGVDLLDWPDACFLPLAVADAYVKSSHTLDEHPDDPVRIAVLGGWRPSLDIYRFEPELFDSIISTDMTKIPAELLLRLPAWTVYIETPGADWLFEELQGFWVSLNLSKTRNLLLQPDYGHGFFNPFFIDLESADIEIAIMEGMDRFYSSITTIDRAKYEEPDDWKLFVAGVTKMLSLVLYICSTEPDIRHTSDSQSWPPAMPAPKKIKTGWRLFAADKPTIWRVGETIARQIRAARSAHTGPHAGPRPHIRRAHWHGFWSGTIKPREGVEPKPRKFELKWLPPVPVAMGDEDKDG